MTTETKLVALKRVPLNINYQQLAEEFQNLKSGESMEVVHVPRAEESKKYQVSVRNALLRRGFQPNAFRTSVANDLMLRIIML